MISITKLKIGFLVSSVALLFSCSKNDPGTLPPGGTTPTTNEEWLIPTNEVRDGGPGKDGIPSVDVPDFALASEIDYLSENDLVIGIKVGDIIRAYPHPILDWHEIVNDNLQSTTESASVAITYCPLTGTAIGWNSEIDGQATTFGVSGLLYNTNLMPYDRQTDSYWSQMRLDCVNGTQIGTEIETVTLVEMSWHSWRQLFPTSMVMTTNTGFTRDYQRYPYDDYRTNHNFLLFNITPDDTRLPRKERVLGVITGNKAKAYRFSSMSEGNVTVINDTHNGTDLVVAGSVANNFMVAYERKLEDGTVLTFSSIQAEGSTIMEDNEGNKWSLFGEAVDGPRIGQKLTPTRSFIGYWLAWGAFYPDLEIYDF